MNTEPISVLIVDDEPLARELLRRLIEVDPRFQLLGECDEGERAIKICETTTFDLILLDIEMPGTSGFDVLSNSFRIQNSIVVMVSAFSEYAANAYTCEVFDYVIKPVDPARFEQTLNRVFRRHQEKRHLNNIASFASKLNGSGTKKPGRRISVNTIRGQIFFDLDNIQVLESVGNYVKIHFQTESHLVRGSLVRLSESLGDPLLIRVHRSYVINLKHIRERSINKTNQTELLMACGEVVPVSKRRRKKVSELLRMHFKI